MELLMRLFHEHLDYERWVEEIIFIKSKRTRMTRNLTDIHGFGILIQIFDRTRKTDQSYPCESV